MLKNYFLVALRNIRRHRLFSSINILGLALGMAICMLPIMKVKEAFEYDSFHPAPERTFRITTQVLHANGDKKLYASTPFALADHLAYQFPQIEHKTTVVITWSDLKTNEVAQTMRGLFADADFYKLFGFKVHGNPGGHGTIVITRHASKRLFGNADPINKVLHMDKVGDVIVAGVMEDAPAPSHLQFEFVADIGAYITANPTLQADLQNEISAYTYVSLPPGTDEHTLNEMLAQSSTYVNKTSLQKNEKRFAFQYQRLDKISPGMTPIYNTTAEPVLPNLLILILIGGVMLALAIINYVNLTVASTMSRAREVGVRKIAGAMKRQVHIQFLLESVIVALVAFLLSQLIFRFTLELPTVYRFVGTVHNDYQLVLWYFLFTVLTGIVAGWIPARIFSAIKPVGVLKGKFDVLLSSRFGIRKMLVIIQFAVSLMAIISVVVFFKQSQFMATSDYGFNKTNVLNVTITPDVYKRFYSAVSNLSGVREVSASSTLFGFGGGEDAVMKSKAAADSIDVNVYSVTPSIISSMKLSMEFGFGFPINDTLAVESVVINEKAARELRLDPAEAPGVNVIINNKSFTVAGVVKDFHYSGFQSAIQPMALRSRASDFRVVNIVFDQGAEKHAIANVENVWKRLNPQREFEARWYDEQLYEAHLHKDDLQFMALLAGITIALACLGLLGIVVLTISNRSKELSVRKIIGASMLELLAVAGKEFLILLLAATVIGTLAGYFSSASLLQQYVYRIAITPLLLGSCALVLIVAGMSIIFLNAFRIASRNPTENLRAE